MKIDVDSDSKWTELPALNSADAGCMADADEFGYVLEKILMQKQEYTQYGL